MAKLQEYWQLSGVIAELKKFNDQQSTIIVTDVMANRIAQTIFAYNHRLWLRTTLPNVNEGDVLQAIGHNLNNLFLDLTTRDNNNTFIEQGKTHNQTVASPYTNNARIISENIAFNNLSTMQQTHELSNLANRSLRLIYDELEQLVEVFA
jgi:hypothetical protein